MAGGSVTIKQVNQQTSSVFGRVAEGEDLVVTKSGRPVARIVPFRPRDLLETMIADGRLEPAAAASAEVAGTRLGRDFEAFLEDERGDSQLW
ncbi:MAG: type II toxin-antitoxin system prevent-host-death family antitoxin [Bifidobacteriaceae bacterium]|nr:type II toxin-antitoxin system prevent-host-death family antitoxin [Bifidobacteriaceae bacterium]